MRVLRSESKSGYDKSLRKGGAGAHNWGSIRDELELERDALEDEDFDAEELDVPDQPNAAVRPGEGADAKEVETVEVTRDATVST